MYPYLYIAKDIVNLLLDVRNKVIIAYDRDLEGLLLVMSDNGEYKFVVRVKKLLIEEGNGV